MWNVVPGVAWRTLKTPSRTRDFSSDGALPLFFFTAFAGGLSRPREIPGFDYPPGYTAFQFVFALLSWLLSAASSRASGSPATSRAARKTPALAAPHRSGIVSGTRSRAVLRWAVVATILTVVALIAGMEIGGGSVDIVGLYVLALLVNFCGFF